MADRVFPPLTTGPKRHHYLPKSYLDGWVDDDKMLWLYDRKTNDYRQQTPKNTTVVGHLYTVEDEQQRSRYEIEAMLADAEGRTTPIIRKLSLNEAIDIDERCHLAHYMGLMAFRTPAIFESIGSMHSQLALRLMKTFAADPVQMAETMKANAGGEGDFQGEAERLAAFVNEGGYTIKTDPKWSMTFAIKMGLELAEHLLIKNWHVIHAPPRCTFITCDAPVLLTSNTPPRNGVFRGVGFGSPDAVVFFPLDQKTAVMMYDDGNKERNEARFEVGRADPDFMRRANLATTNLCQRYLIGSSERLLRSLVASTAIHKRPWNPRMEIR